jgi:hypothetical protein
VQDYLHLHTFKTLPGENGVWQMLRPNVGQNCLKYLHDRNMEKEERNKRKLEYDEENKQKEKNGEKKNENKKSEK